MIIITLIIYCCYAIIIVLYIATSALSSYPKEEKGLARLPARRRAPSAWIVHQQAPNTSASPPHASQQKPLPPVSVPATSSVRGLCQNSSEFSEQETGIGIQ